MKTLTEEEFMETYKPMKNQFHEQDCKEYVAFDGCMYETYGKELEYVMSMAKKKRVWTIIETDDMLHYNTCFSTGMRFVNKFGYFVCEVPYTEHINVNIDAFATSDQVHRFLADYGTKEKVNDDDVLVEWEGKRCYIPDTNTPIKDYKESFTNSEIWEHLISSCILWSQESVLRNDS